MDALRLALNRLSIGQQPSEQLPDIASEALAKGVDSPSLRLLAGTPRNDVREAQDLFLSAMAELGVSTPTATEAAQELVRSWASEIVAGSLSPYEGARQIWHWAWDLLGEPEDLIPFIGLASEWEDDPEHRSDYDREILVRAQKLLEDT